VICVGGLNGFCQSKCSGFKKLTVRYIGSAFNIQGHGDQFVTTDARVVPGAHLRAGAAIDGDDLVITVGSAFVKRVRGKDDLYHCHAEKVCRGAPVVFRIQTGNGLRKPKVDVGPGRAIRAGWKTGYDAEKWSLGAGLKQKIGQQGVAVDFSYSKAEATDEYPIRLSLGLTF
jgi:hypothetical protein